MLDQETKKRIDTARNILVGKVPDPKAQVEQITIALIYKFMDDMDREAQELGGKSRFFTGEYAKYSWVKLMDTRVGGSERLNLYGEAITQMSQNANLPQLFRDIFNGAFLPYRDPETLNLFLKEINGFVYDHSERLGDAFEYLLSVLGSQGDAGQFRTPRHIIDFIVQVVNPQKNESVLDPACGTAGFLISAYKHVLNQNKDKKAGDKLTPEEKKKMMARYVGYDISPDMDRLSRVNMYLHGFPTPMIYEYDTLTSEDRWNETYDVILANPPFMSPTGGIRPHKRFSVQANRSEVLFVDYIAEHLNVQGRAGIIVPEGIIFQSANAYKDLRKMLVEGGYLYAVVSLPAGVFNPYAGVKTSILLLDKVLAKKSKEIIFIKIENDGFDLGAQRKPIDKDDLPVALETINNWKSGHKLENSLAVYVSKDKIADGGDYSLSSDQYRVETDYSSIRWEVVDLEKIVETITPEKKIPKSEYLTSGIYPIIDQSQEIIAGWTSDHDSVIKIKKPVVIFGDHTCAIKYTDRPFAQGADGIKILQSNETVLPKFLYYFLKTNPVQSDGYKRHYSKLKEIKIPVPPLEIQERIILDLDNYQQIISGARQIIDSWQPTVDIDPKWELVKLGDVCDVFGGGTPSRSIREYWNGDIPWISARYFTDDHKINGFEGITKKGLENSSSKLAPKNSTILITRVSVGKYAIADRDYAINQDLTALVPKGKNIDYRYLWLISEIIAERIKQNAKGVGVVGVTRDFVVEQNIPLPPPEVQKKIVEKIESERELVNSSKKLIEIYEQKNRDRIAKVWGAKV